MEFDAARLLVSLQILRTFTEMSRVPIEPVCVERAKLASLRLMNKGCDRSFAQQLAFDELRQAVQVKFSELPTKSLIQWANGVFFELAEGGHLTRIVCDLTKVSQDVG